MYKAKVTYRAVNTEHEEVERTEWLLDESYLPDLKRDLSDMYVDWEILKVEEVA
jgi:hypothetical protein